MSLNPLLSICIPTYNRAEYLKKTIDSIINQKDFDERIEIVISDNCSTDNTENLCMEYTSKFSNIKYFRNDDNIADRNFPLVINRAKGLLRKLCNDTLLFNEGSLKYLLQLEEDNLVKKPVIFINNKGEDNKRTVNLDGFLYTVSYNITWIGGLCIWGEDFHYIEDGCNEKLWQEKYLLKYISERRNTLIINKNLFKTQSLQKKNISYGLYKIFYINYLRFIQEYVDKQQISQNCVDWLEKDLLFNFFPFWMINFEKQNKSFLYSQEENLIECIKQTYKNKVYYKEFLRFYKIIKIKSFIKSMMKICFNIERNKSTKKGLE